MERGEANLTSALSFHSAVSTSRRPGVLLQACVTPLESFSCKWLSGTVGSSSPPSLPPPIASQPGRGVSWRMSALASLLLGQGRRAALRALSFHSRSEPSVLLSACWGALFQLPSWEHIPHKLLALIPLSYGLLLGEPNPRQLPH